jgi:hypothetical protein
MVTRLSEGGTLLKMAHGGVDSLQWGQELDATTFFRVLDPTHGWVVRRRPRDRKMAEMGANGPFRRVISIAHDGRLACVTAVRKIGDRPRHLILETDGVAVLRFRADDLLLPKRIAVYRPETRDTPRALAVGGGQRTYIVDVLLYEFRRLARSAPTPERP